MRTTAGTLQSVLNCPELMWTVTPFSIHGLDTAGPEGARSMTSKWLPSMDTPFARTMLGVQGGALSPLLPADGHFMILQPRGNLIPRCRSVVRCTI